MKTASGISPTTNQDIPADGDSCEGCPGSGARVPATPSCHLGGLPSGWVVIERCDACERFASDLEAANSISAEVREITCAAGGQHVIAHWP
jgi:hypothetical protein